MSGETTEARARCHAIFNNAAFGDVVVTADRLLSEGPDGTVTTRRVAAVTGIADSVVRQVMVRLVAAQMLYELPKIGPTNGPRLFYRRNDDRWVALTAVVTALTKSDPSPLRADQSKQT
jgi:hypothetical protein